MPPQTPTPAPSAASTYGIPVAIVIGFGMIAAAIYFSGIGTTPAPVMPAVGAPEEEVAGEVSPVTEADFIRGNPNAPIMIVEYSDYDCPFCKQYHETMNKIIAEYGVDGKVAWVYRQFPLEQLHPNAPRISEAAYCVGELGGDEAFWKFSDTVFGEKEINTGTNMTRLPEFAVTAGVDKAAFTNCLESGKHKATVEASIEDGVKAGARGTPYSVIVVGDQQAVINGAQPYNVVKQTIDSSITQLEGGKSE